jgi:hypothetical protein
VFPVVPVASNEREQGDGEDRQRFSLLFPLFPLFPSANQEGRYWNSLIDAAHARRLARQSSSGSITVTTGSASSPGWNGPPVGGFPVSTGSGRIPCARNSL